MHEPFYVNGADPFDADIKAGRRLPFSTTQQLNKTRTIPAAGSLCVALSIFQRPERFCEESLGHGPQTSSQEQQGTCSTSSWL
jgi:hypothetical protein